jgi:hypothetical protein
MASTTVSENMSSYVFSDEENTVLIPISGVEFDHVMINTLDKHGAGSGNLIKSNRNRVVGNTLSRIDGVLGGMKDAVEFDRIVVNKHVAGGHRVYVPPGRRTRDGEKYKTVPETVTYSITDGRHRVVASVISDFSHVPARITSV